MLATTFGYDLALQGDAGQGLAYCQRAHELCHQAELNPVLTVHIHASLGYVYRCLGDQPQAIASYRRAVRTAESIGAPHLAAESLVGLGDCHAVAGDADAAVIAWRRALVVFEQLGHPDTSVLSGKLSDVISSAGMPRARDDEPGFVGGDHRLGSVT